jgi:predicted DNA-binding transcriptional regulator AlpA
MSRESTLRAGDDEPVEHTMPAYWDIADIQFHCRIGRTTAWRLVRESAFPAPVVIGPKTLVWPRDEVVQFMDGRREADHYSRCVATPPAVAEQSRLYRVRSVRARERDR